MATASFRPDLIESFKRTDDDMFRMTSDIKETVIATRELIEASRSRIREADRLLAQK